MGDFNSEPETMAIKTIKTKFEDGGKLVNNGIYGPIGTFTGFEMNIIPERRIDYIFVKGMKVVKYRHIDDKMKNNNYLSDHLPVLIEVK
jgi:endonuclease/exonuclease/phosphatase family metal-dependent hydrolase